MRSRTTGFKYRPSRSKQASATVFEPVGFRAGRGDLPKPFVARRRVWEGWRGGNDTERGRMNDRDGEGSADGARRSDATVRIGDRVIEQSALKERASRAAAAIVAAGVQHGERVAIVLRNDPAFLMLSAASAVLGAVPVPVNWHWRGDELRHVLTHSGARVVFVHS